MEKILFSDRMPTQEDYPIWVNHKGKYELMNGPSLSTVEWFCVKSPSSPTGKECAPIYGEISIEELSKFHEYWYPIERPKE